MATPYFYIALTVLLTLYGQIVIKWRVNLHAGKSVDMVSYVASLLLDPFILSGLAAAFLASLTWMLALSRLELSRAYPFMAMSFVLVPLAAWLILSEGVTWNTFFGAALIVCGIAISVVR